MYVASPTDKTCFIFIISSFLRLGNMGSRIWGRDLCEAYGALGTMRETTGEKSNAAAIKAPQILQGGSSGVGRALQSCLQMKQRMRRPSLFTLAFDEGCLWGEGFQIPSARGSPGWGLTGSPSACNSFGGWRKEWLVLNGESEGIPQHHLTHCYW